MHDVFDTFEFERAVTPETIEKYKDKLPAELIEVWEKYGYGTLLDGYLKIIDPDEYREILNNTYYRAEVSIPIMATAFADIITWEKDRYIGSVKYRWHNGSIIAASFNYFFNDLLDSPFLKEEDLQWQPYPEAVKLHGKPAYDECFMHLPLLCAGGDGSPEKIAKGDLKTHIILMTEFCGPIEWSRFGGETFKSYFGRVTNLDYTESSIDFGGVWASAGGAAATAAVVGSFFPGVGTVAAAVVVFTVSVAVGVVYEE